MTYRHLLQAIFAFAVLKQAGSHFFGLPDEWRSRFLPGLPEFRRRLKFDDSSLGITVVRNQSAIARGCWMPEGREDVQPKATLYWLSGEGRADRVERDIARLDAEKFQPDDTVVIRFLLQEGRTVYPILAELMRQAADEWVYAPQNILREHGYDGTSGPELRQQVITRMSAEKIITYPTLPARQSVTSTIEP